MSFRSSLTSVLCFLTSFGFSQQGLLFEKEPSWVKQVPFAETTTDTTQVTGGFYYLLFDQQIHVDNEEVYRHYATKIFSENGLQQGSSINESFDPAFEKLIFHTVQIRRGHQVINKLDPHKFEILRREENMDRHIYDGTLSVILNLEGVEPGDVVEYAYTVRGRNPLFRGKFFGVFGLNFSVPVGKLNCALTISKNRKIQFRYVHTSLRLSSKREAGEFATYQLTLENVAPQLPEDQTPPWYELYSKIELSEFQSWQEFQSWAHTLFQVNEPPSPKLVEKVNEIRKHSIDQRVQIRQCIEWVQDEIRYLSFSSGINGYKPHSPGQVFTQRFGDCKDKSLLLSFMLRQLGIESSPALVSSEEGIGLPDHLPSPYRFDHCILKINLKDTVCWVDPTISFQRGKLSKRSIPSYHYAIVVDQSNEGLQTIPFGQYYSGIAIVENFDVGEVGTHADLEVTTRYTGSDADVARLAQLNNSKGEINKNYLNFYATDYTSIVSKSDVKFEDDTDANIVTTREHYRIESFWKYDSVSRQYQAETFARYLSEYLKSPDTKIRRTPYSIPYPANIDHVIKLKMPQTWGVTNDYQKINSNAVYFTKSVNYRDKIITLQYLLQTQADYVKADDVKGLIEKMALMRNSLSFLLTYSTDNKSATSLNWPYFIISVGFIAVLAFGFKQLYRYDPEPQDENEYSHIGGWLILPAIGLFITPFVLIYGVATGNFFDNGMWLALTDSTYSAYNPKLGTLVLMELLSNLFLISYIMFLNLMFWKKRTSFPRLVIFFYAYSLTTALLDAWATQSFTGSLEGIELREIVRQVVGTAIWVPYFIFSYRVKSTFTTRLESQVHANAMGSDLPMNETNSQ